MNESTYDISRPRQHRPSSIKRPLQYGWRRTDMYGFERYEDDRRDWYILSGEQEAERYAQHDLELERRCSERLWALLFEDGVM